MTEFRNLDWPKVLENISSFATSSGAKQRILETTALNSADSAEKQFSEIEESIPILKNGARPYMESLDFFSLWHERLKKQAVLKPLEFKDIRRFCLEVLALDEILSQCNGTWIGHIRFQLMKAKEPLTAIDQVMTPEGDIKIDASPTLARLYKDKQDLERQIRTTLDKLVKGHELDSLLQDKYVTNREGRWVLPVKSGMQNHIEGIIHDSSQTKQTVFMEPQVVIPINNQLRRVNISIDEEIERILTQLSDYLASLASAFDESRNALLETDIRLAQAMFAMRTEGSPCQFNENEIVLKGLKHPLLVFQDATNIVPNTLDLTSQNRILLLSGPNAGGKTVLLKSLGLAAQMARCGLFVCADSGSRLPFFERIFSTIGDSQSVDLHLSTFAAHLKSLTEATHAQGPHHLVLADEICGSTDPDEGTLLARSFLEHYAEQKCYGMVTSHLGPLKEGWGKETGVIGGSMDYSEEMNRPSYRLVMGLPGRSQALRTARKAGVPSAIIERAISLADPISRARENKLEELEGFKQEVLLVREKLIAETKSTHELRAKYTTLIDNFKREKDVWLKKSVEMAEKKIEKLIEDFRQTGDTKKAPDIKSQLPQIIRQPRTTQILTAEDFSEKFPPGSVVFIPRFNQDGVVQGTPNQKGELPVLSNSMRLFIHWTQLQAPKSAPNPTLKIARKQSHFSMAKEDRILDLRGQTVEEALHELEIQLDLAIQNQEDRIKVIHGHGTEALKKAVRTTVSRHSGVKKWKSGEMESGGDGVTWIELDS